MNHTEAVETMAAERYLLDELMPEARDSFEEHVFECPECAFDLRTGAAFIAGARDTLPGFSAIHSIDVVKPESERSRPRGLPTKRKLRLFAWATPALAASLAVIAYQNFETIPSLRSAASVPRLLPVTELHMGVRGSEHTIVQADSQRGAVILINLPRTADVVSFALTLRDAQDNAVWSQEIRAGSDLAVDAPASLFIPAPALRQASYTLQVSGTDSQGHSASIERRILDFHF